MLPNPRHVFKASLGRIYNIILLRKYFFTPTSKLIKTIHITPSVYFSLLHAFNYIVVRIRKKTRFFFLPFLYNDINVHALFWTRRLALFKSRSQKKRNAKKPKKTAKLKIKRRGRRPKTKASVNYAKTFFRGLRRKLFRKEKRVRALLA